MVQLLREKYMQYFYVDCILMCTWMIMYILCSHNTAFSLRPINSPNVADFNTTAIIHIIIPINTEQAWSLNALLKDMKHIKQSVAHDQADV